MSGNPFLISREEKEIIATRKIPIVLLERLQVQNSPMESKEEIANRKIPIVLLERIRVETIESKNNINGTAPSGGGQEINSNKKKIQNVKINDIVNSVNDEDQQDDILKVTPRTPTLKKITHKNDGSKKLVPPIRLPFFEDALKEMLGKHLNTPQNMQGNTFPCNSSNLVLPELKPTKPPTPSLRKVYSSTNRTEPITWKWERGLKRKLEQKSPRKVFSATNRTEPITWKWETGLKSKLEQEMPATLPGNASPPLSDQE